MPRKKTTTSSVTSTPISEEKPDLTPPETEATELDSTPPEAPESDPTPPEVAEPDNSSAENSTSTSPPSPTSEIQLQPAKFAREGRQTICTVCGTEARLNLDQELFCPNAHNHPPLATTETANS